MRCRSDIVTCDSWLVTRLTGAALAKRGGSFLKSDERRATRHGFTLIEGMAAIALLAFIGAGVWVVMDRCMLSTADSVQRMRAFETARENMEKVLGSSSVEETTEFGVSEKYPDIRWQTTVESFYPDTSGSDSRMWVRATAVAEYTDSAGETRFVELCHWLTDLTDEQMQQLRDMKKYQEKRLARHIIETEELAAQYAGVNTDTIRQWVKNGMPTSDDGYLKPLLDLYLHTQGKPTAQDLQNIITEFPELMSVLQKRPVFEQHKPTTSQTKPPSKEDLQKLTEGVEDSALKEKLKELFGL